METVYWLAVETGGLIWPKEASVLPDEVGRWSAVIREEGSPDMFSVSIWAVSPQGDRRIRDWLDRGRRTDDYPGLSSLPGARRIAQVNGLRLAENGIG